MIVCGKKRLCLNLLYPLIPERILAIAGTVRSECKRDLCKMDAVQSVPSTPSNSKEVPYSEPDYFSTKNHNKAPMGGFRESCTKVKWGQHGGILNVFTSKHGPLFWNHHWSIWTRLWWEVHVYNGPLVKVTSKPCPFIRDHKKVSVHGLSESCPVQLRGYYCRHSSLASKNAAGFYVHLQLLIPSECSNKIYKTEKSIKKISIFTHNLSCMLREHYVKKSCVERNSINCIELTEKPNFA